MAGGRIATGLSILAICLLVGASHFRTHLVSRAPRNVYLDLGANWAQTLDLHQRLLGKSHRGHTVKDGTGREESWEVYSFEASPWIGWYVDQVVAAKNNGRDVPELPFPPSGSSADLRRFASKAGCNERASTNEVRACMLDKYLPKLRALELDPKLNDSRLIGDRLAEASRPYREAGVRYTFVPAAVTATSGWMDIRQSMLQLLIGGVVTSGKETDWTQKFISQDEFFPVARVPTVDIVQWLRNSFSARDNVIVKMDIEGAEFSIIPELVKQRADSIIKVLAMECHEGKGGRCSGLQSLLQKTRIKVLKEGVDYNGWK